MATKKRVAELLSVLKHALFRAIATLDDHNDHEDRDSAQVLKTPIFDWYSVRCYQQRSAIATSSEC